MLELSSKNAFPSSRCVPDDSPIITCTGSAKCGNYLGPVTTKSAGTYHVHLIVLWRPPVQVKWECHAPCRSGHPIKSAPISTQWRCHPIQAKICIIDMKKGELALSESLLIFYVWSSKLSLQFPPKLNQMDERMINRIIGVPFLFSCLTTVVFAVLRMNAEVIAANPV